MRKKAKFELDNSTIKVPFDELLYDIIFVIGITKITEILFASHEINWQIIASSIIIFISLVWVWLFRVKQLNKIHILQNKLDTQVLKSARLSYVEMVCVVSLIFSLNRLSYQFILLVILISGLITHFSFNRIRRQVIKNAEIHAKFRDEYGYKRPENYRQIVNVEYMYERFGILFVLFMGEILSTSFSITENIFDFFLVAVLIVCVFNNNINILKISKDYVEASKNQRVYRLTIDYAKSLLSLLLIILISIEATEHFGLSEALIMFSLLIYFLTEHRMKKAMGVKGKKISMFINLIAIIIIIFPIEVQPIFKIILGTLVFIINMYTNEKQ